jgi:hypothetical protein
MTSVSLLFLIGLATTLLLSIIVVHFLSVPLRKQLFELCGNADRAEFWSVFSNVILALVPIVFAMQYEPSPQSCSPWIFEFVAQIKWGITGLVFSMLMLGWILGRFIRKLPPPTPGPAFKSEALHS